MQPVTHTVRLRPELVALAERIPELPLLVVSATGGSGKSTLLAAWRSALEADGRRTAWLDLAPLHSDLGSFLEELATEVQRGMPTQVGDGFGATLLRRLPHMDDTDPHQLSRWLADELRELAEPVTIFLDNYHRLPPACTVDQLLSQALRDAIPGLHLVVATRGARPSASTRLLAEGRALEVVSDDLSLRADQVEQILVDRGVGLDAELLPRLLAQTRGWATGVLLAARVLSEQRPNDPGRFIGELARHEDLFGYVANELLAEEPEAVLRLLEQSALLGAAPRSVLEELVGKEESPRIDEAIDRGLLLAHGGRIGLHQLWESLLRERLRRRLSPDVLAVGMARAVEVLERAGESHRAVELAVELAQWPLVIALVERYGLGWIERGLHDSVSRWLAAVPHVPHDSDDLALVRAMLKGRRHAVGAIESLEHAAERFRRRGANDQELVALHNALILSANESLDSTTRRIAMKIVRPRRLLASREARSTAMLFMGVAAVLSGRYRFARPLLDRLARSDFAPRERGGLTLVRCQIAIASGNWERAVDLANESLSDPAQRSHGPSYYGLRSMRAYAQGVLRRDLARCLEQLEESREAFRSFRLAVSEAETSAFLGQLLLREGRTDEACDALEVTRRLYEELEVSEGVGNVDALLARAHRQLGNPVAAVHHARAAVMIFSEARDLRRRPWSGALAARLLAEEGELATARAFIARRARALDVPELPASQHACHLALARISELSGDDAGCRTHLERARTAAAVGKLKAPLPDLDDDLLVWADRTGEALGLASSAPTRGPDGTAVQASVPALRIVTLGDFRVERNGAAVDARGWRGANPQRFLQRLLVAGGRPLSRERLAADFWPDAPPAKARSSLRTALLRLRQALDPGRSAGDPERWLIVDGEQVAVAAETLAAWDVQQWRERLAAARADTSDAALERALQVLECYTGPFLPDVFDDWALEIRRELEETFVRCARETSQDLLAHGRPEEAARLASRLIAQDPADEAAWAAKAEAEIALGDRRAASRTLEGAEAALRRELGRGLGPELAALARSLA